MKKLCEITMVLLLILSLFSVLVIMNVPIVKAELNAPTWNPAGYYETPNADWTIQAWDDISYENSKIVVNGGIVIQKDGKLTLSNVTLQMNETTSDAGDKIQVDDEGELNVINGSTITTNPITALQTPDPYEFRIDGSAVIENSTVEKMADLAGEADGIQIYSSSVTITNSSIRSSDGNGIYINNTNPTIKNCTISNNHFDGVYMNLVSNCILENNIVNSNDDDGIHLESSSNNNITGNNFSSNSGEGIDLRLSTYNNITNNYCSFNNGNGIHLYGPSNDNNISRNTVLSNSLYGISLWFSYRTNVTNNIASSNTWDGIYITSSRNTVKYNIVSSNSHYGIALYGGLNNVVNNTIYNNYYGMWVQNTRDNLIYHNQFIDNTHQAFEGYWVGYNSDWDNGYPSGGNYWSDFDEPSEGAYDDYHGPDQDILGGDGIVDNGSAAGGGKNPYVIDDDSQDNYPLIKSWARVHNINKDLWYHPIQLAIDDADFGNTLEAMRATFNENVVVNKTVTIIGKYGTTNTIIDGGGSGDVINITANWVNITGFTITNSGSSDGDVGIELNSVGNCRINNTNISSNNNYGIYLYLSSNNSITDNKVSSNNDDSIYLRSSSNNTITNNNINNNAQGIALHSSCNNTLSSNTITSNSNEGIWINTSSDYNIVYNNTMSSNSKGIYLVTSSNNNMSANTITWNTNEGIRINGNSNHNDIANNNISNNSKGIYLYNLGGNDCIVEENLILDNDFGVYTYNSSPIIRYNNISCNDLFGIRNNYYSNPVIGNNTILDNGQGIENSLNSNGTIDNNTISSNSFGILCTGSSPMITYNNITFNTYGVETANTTQPGSPVVYVSDPSVHWNNIHNSTNFDLKNSDPSNTIDAENNYWG